MDDFPLVISLIILNKVNIAWFSVFPSLVITLKIRNNITKLIKSHYPDAKLQFVYKPSKRLSSLLKYKDFFPPLVSSNVTSTRVVAAMPLIMVRPPEILRYVGLSTLGLIKVEEFVPLPVLHPSGIISSNQVILVH